MGATRVSLMSVSENLHSPLVFFIFCSLINKNFEIDFRDSLFIKREVAQGYKYEYFLFEVRIKNYHHRIKTRIFSPDLGF